MTEKIIRKTMELITQKGLAATFDYLLTLQGRSKRLDILIATLSNSYNTLYHNHICGAISYDDLVKKTKPIAGSLIFELNSIKIDEDKKRKLTVEEYKGSFEMAYFKIKIWNILFKNCQEERKLTISDIVKATEFSSKHRGMIVKNLERMLALGFVNKQRIDQRMCWVLSNDGQAFFEQYHKS